MTDNDRLALRLDLVDGRLDVFFTDNEWCLILEGDHQEGLPCVQATEAQLVQLRNWLNIALPKP